LDSDWRDGLRARFRGQLIASSFPQKRTRRSVLAVQAVGRI
jgi:hypothetical protein